MTVSSDGRTVVVVGAGFSGAVAAARLLRAGRAGGGGLRVVLVNRSQQMARGVAYGTRTASHLLNVPAGRMSAFAEDDDHFLRFAQARDYSIVGGTFVPRALYGEYLEFVLDEAEREAAPGAVLERVVGEVVDLEPTRDGDAADVAFADGSSVRAHAVILALGNHTPADPPMRDRAVFASPRYVRDPWKRGAFEAVDHDRPVLLIGTGLTTLDVVLELHARGMRAPMIAFSRRGLLPLPHRAATAPPSYQHRPPDIETAPPTATAYLRSVRAHVAKLAAEGIDWREVVASLRPITPQLWQRLSATERARFMRHVRPYWETHRHRAAPMPFGSFERLRLRGELRVVAARLQRLVATSDGFDAELRHRVSGEVETFHVGHVINCTGPQGDPRRIDDPLIGSLLARGILRPDAHGLGVDVDERLSLIDCAGNASRLVRHVGPMLKAHFWEATAVPELRVHAARAAEEVLRALE